MAVTDVADCKSYGDLVGGVADGAPGLAFTREQTEFGQPRATADVGNVRYGWLGADKRAADTPGGFILMGVRLYNPSTGRFLQVDPVPGGSCNAYDYACADPVNNKDISGKKCWGPRWICRTLKRAGDIARRGARKVWDKITYCYNKWYKCLKLFEEYVIAPLVIIGMIVVIAYAIFYLIGSGVALISAIIGIVFLVTGIFILAYLLYRVIRRMIQGRGRRVSCPQC